jgi:flagellar basal-body rod protein FlgB
LLPGINPLETVARESAAMKNDGMGLFDLAERKLAWVDKRQGLLAQNIANANSPGYVAKDLQPFAKLLAQSMPDMAVTNAAHMTGTSSVGRTDPMIRPSERAPDGNAVSIETEMTKVADDASTQALVTNLYHKYLGLFRIAIGK